MSRLGVAPELVLDLAARHSDDRAVLEALRALGIPSAAEAWFDGRRSGDRRLRAAVAVHGAAEILTSPA
jgi:hypothetical protein